LWSTDVTTEDDLQAMLDAHPDDHLTRLVLADFLDERGDPRGSGYRALGVLPSRPEKYEDNQWGYDLAGYFHDSGDDLPKDWFLSMKEPPRYRLTHWSSLIRTGPSRRVIEDAAALAFSRLPADRQHELLNPQPTGK
jgi:uncharacterized protein (TIGR02996 family)